MGDAMVEDGGGGEGFLRRRPGLVLGAVAALATLLAALSSCEQVFLDEEDLRAHPGGGR